MEGRRTKLTEVNPYLICVLCHGYFVDATTIAECLHSFCRSCIFRQLERKSICPICEVQVHNTKLHLSLRLDKTLQDIVYKLVPGLFHNEMQRRRDFYKDHPYRDEHLDPESRGVGLDRLIYSPDDLISLSLEFYDKELEKEEWSSINNNNSPKPIVEKEVTNSTKRYLQCPAGFKMAHLKKFIKQKYGLASNCNVEIMYRRESLPDSYSLMDIAYIYTWKRNGPMRFYYRMPDVVQKQIMPSDLEVKKPTREENQIKKIEMTNSAGNKKEAKIEMTNGKSREKVEKTVPSLQNGLEKHENKLTIAEKKTSPESEKKAEQKTEKKTEQKTEKLAEQKTEMFAEQKAEKKTEQVTEKKTEEKADKTEEKNSEIVNKIDQEKEKTDTGKSKVVSKEESKESEKSSLESKEPLLPNGIATHRPLSKQDELSVSVLLSLGNCRVAEKEAQQPEHNFLMPKPVQPQTPTTFRNKKILNGKLNPKFSVNKIASELAQNNRLNSAKKTLPWQQPKPALPQRTEEKQSPHPKSTDKSDPFVFQPNEQTIKPQQINGTSQICPSPTYKPPMAKTTELTVPPLKISLSKVNSPRIEPANSSSIQSKANQVPMVVPPIPALPTTPPVPQNEIVHVNERPEVTVKTTNGSLTITTQPPLPQKLTPPPTDLQRKSPVKQQQIISPKISPGKKMNGNVVTIMPEGKMKDNALPALQNTVNSKLPTLQKQILRKATGVVPGGVISKTGPTLDQRIQQLYKNQNNRQGSPQTHPVNQLPSSGKQQESRLANWLNNRFPPQPKSPATVELPAPKSPTLDEKPKEGKESDMKKLGKDFIILKRKLDELRGAQSVCKITQENPNPDLVKKLRDVTPDVSIEFMRASDMVKVDIAAKSKEKPAKRPIPALKAIQEMDMTKRKNVEDDKSANKKPKLASKKQDEALDLSGSGNKPSVELAHRMALLHQNGRSQQPPSLPWMVNRPLLANQHFIPRTT